MNDVTTVDDLVRHLALDRARVATELNFNVVPRKDYATTKLNDGDKVEIVTFVGGG